MNAGYLQNGSNGEGNVRSSAPRVILRAIQLEQIGNSRLGFSFFPRKTYIRKVHVCLWPQESFFNIQYLAFFRDCDLNDVEVIVHCARNLLPVASLVSHRVVLQEAKHMVTSVFHPNARLSRYGYDMKGEQETFGIRTWDFGRKAPKGLIPRTDEELKELFSFFIDKPLSIEEGALEWFRMHQEEFPEDATDVELKNRWGKVMEQKLLDLKDPTLIGIDKGFQNEILKRYPETSQFFLSLQLLCGLFRRWSFIGFHGASSVFSLLFPVNLILSMDRGNLTVEMRRLRSWINEHWYRTPSLGSHVVHRDWADRLALDPIGFADHVLCAMENRKNAKWPEVLISKG